MCETHRLIVIHPYAKYGKPMSNRKSYGLNMNLHEQTDRWKDSDSYIPPELRSLGV